MRVHVLALLAMTGCQVSLKLPPQASVKCASNKECPTGYSCSVTLSRCVQVGADAEAPQVVDGSLVATPTLVNAQTRFTVSFDVSEDLASAPVVELRFKESGQSAQLTMDSNDARHYVYGIADLSLPQGDLADVQIGLLDTAGNPGSTALASAATFDFIAPSIEPTSVLVTLIPAPGNPLSQPTAVTTDTTIELRFVASEVLADTSTISSTSGLSLALGGAAGLAYVYATTVAATDSDGAQALTISAIDLAGNVTTQALTTVTVDHVPPEIDASKVLLRRRPNGDSATREATIELSASASAFAAGEEVRVYTEAATEARYLVGSSTADASGALLPFELSGDDDAQRFVLAIDPAGNTSPLVAVKHGLYTAAFADKRVNSTIANPHFAATVGATSSKFLDASLFELSGQQYEGLVNLDPRSAVTTSAVGFRNQGSARLTGGSNGVGVLLAETHTQSTLLLNAEERTVFAFDGRAWTQRQPVNLPPARSDSSVAYLPSLAQSIMFGGLDSTAGFVSLADTWSYDGTAWHEISDAQSPPSRFSAALAYDPESDHIILFGGANISTTGLCPLGSTKLDLTVPAVMTVCILSDTWAWGTDGWSEHHPLHVPPPRYAVTMAYDPGTGGMIVMGGATDLTGTQLQDTWRFIDGDWVEVVSNTPPSARTQPTLVTSFASAGVYLFGGSNCASDCDHVFHLDPTGWTDTGDVLPFAAPERPNGAYDPNSALLIAVAGISGPAPQGSGLDTWGFDGATWHVVTSGFTSITKRYRHAAVYDAARSATIVFGGERVADVFDDSNSVGHDEILSHGNDTPASFDPELWEWKDEHWTRRCQTKFPLDPDYCDPVPRNRTGAAMVDLPGAGVGIYGGLRTNSDASPFDDAFLGDFWSWDGSAFTLLCDPAGTCPAPPARMQPGLVYDTARQRVVLFGGAICRFRAAEPRLCEGGAIASGPGDYGDTWEWGDFGSPTCDAAGSSPCWKQITPLATPPYGTPPPRRGAMMVFDSRSNQTVMYGGTYFDLTVGGYSSGSRHDAWSWDGIGWTQHVFAPGDPAPSLGAHATMATYDEARGKMIVLAGDKSTNDLWEYSDAEGFTVVRSTVLPAPRPYGTLTYENAARRLLVVGGALSSLQSEADRWERDSLADDRPAVWIQLDWSAAEVGASAVVGAHFDVSAGGSGTNDAGVRVDGAVVQAWDNRTLSWVTLGSTSQPVDQPTQVVIADRLGADARALIDSASNVFIRVRPAAARGIGAIDSTVAVDAASVTFDYVLP